jgi:hypothetical protein
LNPERGIFDLDQVRFDDSPQGGGTRDRGGCATGRGNRSCHDGSRSRRGGKFPNLATSISQSFQNPAV